MDARQIDAKRSDVTFDLHCAWIGGALGRQVSRPCDAWQALALALEQAALEPVTETTHRKSAAASVFTARQLRETLVSKYMEQNESEIQEILEAKCEDTFSFLSRCNIVDLNQARSIWDWYLLELLNFDESGKGSPFRIPFDLVDIQILACVFDTQINILHLLEQSQKIPPHCKTPPYIARLLHHRGHWAAVQGPTKPDMELQPLWGAVVEIGEMLPGCFERAAGRTAVIKDYDEETNCYMGCINQTLIPLGRDQIRRVLISASECDSANTVADEGAASRLKATWHGIAPQSVEWSVLQELVRHEGFRRLEAMQQDLAGRVTLMEAQNSAAPAETHHNAAPTRSQRQPRQPRQNTFQQQPQHQPQLQPQHQPQHQPQQCCAARGTVKRVRWTDVVRDIESSPKCVIVPAIPSVHNFEAQLRVQKADEVMIKRATGDTDLCWVLGEKAGLEGWISSDNLLIWTVAQRFEEPHDSGAGTFLPLEIGQIVIIKERYGGDWAGWAFGEEWKEEGGSEEQPRRGVFPLRYVVPHVLSRAEQH